eukprot:jgi/Mesen1/9701/ME000069S09102
MGCKRWSHSSLLLVLAFGFSLLVFSVSGEKESASTSEQQKDEEAEPPNSPPLSSWLTNVTTSLPGKIKARNQEGPATLSYIQQVGKVRLVSFSVALKRARQYTIFISLLERSGLVPYLYAYLYANKPTFLIPNDNAFRRLPASIKRRLDKDQVFLIHLLAYHIIDAMYSGKQLQTMRVNTRIPTAHGASLIKHASKSRATVVLGPDGARAASQFVVIDRLNLYHSKYLNIHGVNKVLIPPF